MLLVRTTVLALAFGASACGDASAITLTGTLGNASVAIEPGALGARLVGAFTMSLDLGPSATGSTTVELATFALLAEGGATLVQPLDTSTNDAFPLVLGPGDRKQVEFTIGSQKLLLPEQRDGICAGAVLVRGAVTDSLSGGEATTMTAGPLTASGC